MQFLEAGTDIYLLLLRGCFVHGDRFGAVIAHGFGLYKIH